MPPLAARGRNPASRPASTGRPAAAGVLVAALIGVLCFRGERQPPAPTGQSLPPAAKPAALAATQAPLTAQDLRSSPVVPPALGAGEGAFWSAEERELIRVRARGAPGAIAAWAVALPSGGNRRFALEAAALAWGAGDPAAAAQWARSLPHEGERALALTCIAGEAVRSEPLLALELSRSLPEAARDEIVVRGAMEWAARDPDAAAEWARQIPGASLRARVIAGVAIVWSDRAPVSGASLAANELPAGRLQADSVVSIVQRWARQSPDAAAGWILGFPEGELRDAAMECLVPPVDCP